MTGCRISGCVVAVQLNDKSADGETMAEDQGLEPAELPDARLISQGAISDEALRKAEEFVEQEEGAANRLIRLGRHGRHRDRDRDDAVPPLCRLQHSCRRSRCATPTSPS